MSLRATILWWLAAAVLAAAAWTLLRRAEEAPRGPQALLAVGDLPVDRVDEIRIERGDEAEWVFRRDGAKWNQVEPFAHPVDAVSMRRHVVAAESLKASRGVSIEEVEDRGALGLEPPLAKVAFAWSDAAGERRDLAFDLGRPSVAGRAWIRRRDGSLVHAVDTGLHDRIVERHPRDWRRRQLLDLPTGEVDRIELDFADADGVEIVRDGQRWRLTAPIETRLDREAVESWIAALARIEAAAFFEDEPADRARYGLDAPAETLVLERRSTTPDGGSAIERESLRIGTLFGPGSTDRFAEVEGRPVVLLLAEGARATVLRPLTSLVDPTGTAVAASEIAAIEIRTAEETFRIRRELDGFVAERLDAGGDVIESTPLDRARAEALLEKLTAARAPEISVSSFPQEMLAGLAILEGFGGRPLDAVRIARDPDTGRWALDNGDDVLRVFPPSFEPRLRGADYGLTPLPSRGTP
ncbi:MAG: DUF4340 domain-containing protein [Phycisphaerales bacterium]